MPHPHPFKEILIAIANGEQIQFQSLTSGWQEETVRDALADIATRAFEPCRYRVKPKTIRIGELDILAPLREAPAMGTRYWIVDLHHPEKVNYFNWRDDGTDRRWLERGLIHLTEEGALTHANALLGFTSHEE